MIKIIKRDGRKVEHKKEKIINAIQKSMLQTSIGIDENIISKVVSDVETLMRNNITVEEIQDMVEDKLIEHGRADAAKKYIAYRRERTIARERQSVVDREMTGLFDMSNQELIRDNANKDGKKIQSYRSLIADIACTDYAKRNNVPKYLLEAHEEGSIYIHDINYANLPFFNCMLINYPDMLDNGFEISNTKIETPKSITTAIALLSQIVAHVSSNCYGGVTLPDLDVHLDKYLDRSFVKHYKKGLKWILGLDESGINNFIKDKHISLNNKDLYKLNDTIYEFAKAEIEKELNDACQSLEYEIQTLTNSRGEVPFVTISIGKGETENAKKIQENILKARLRGLTGDVTPIFPKICFWVKKGLNKFESDPHYDIFKLAIKTSAKRLYPDYLFFEKAQEVTGQQNPPSPMGCRSFLGKYLDENGEEKTLGRFNCGVATVILPHLALKASGDEERFYELLDESLEKCREVLMFRKSLLKGVRAEQSPILYMSGAVSRLEPNDTIDDLLENGYSTYSIGYLGVANACKALYGKTHSEDEKIHEKAKEIVTYIRNYCDNVKKETGMGFSLYSTPAESLCSRACKKDIQMFGMVDGVTSFEYYTNSFHVPVEQEVNPFEKIDIESKIGTIASGGAIFYTQYGSMIHNEKALEDILVYASDKVHYKGVNVASDICFMCNYRGEILPIDIKDNRYKCPKCGNEDNYSMNVVRRTCGYLSTTSERSCVDNKMKEIHSRVKHFKANDEI